MFGANATCKSAEARFLIRLAATVSTESLLLLLFHSKQATFHRPPPLPFLCSTDVVLASGDLQALLSKSIQRTEAAPPPLRLISYDLQLQVPLLPSQMCRFFTGRVVLQFELTTQIGPESPFVSEASETRAKLTFEITELDHFENVSLVFSGTELEIYNVLLTDDTMEISVNQPVLFRGRYTLSVHRYKGLVGNAIYYRDAGEHAVFGSALFPRRSSAVFPTYRPTTSKALFSISMVHPLGTTAISSAPQEGHSRKIDTNWQTTSFATTSPVAASMMVFSILPLEYTTIESTYTGTKLSIWYNKYRIQVAQAKHLLNTATQVLALLKQLFSSLVPVAKLDMILMHDINPNPSFGAVIIPEAQFYSSDYANQIYQLASLLSRQWIGGLAVISDERELCFQEDIVAFVAAKIVRRMTNDDFYRLAHYAKVVLTETLFLPGELLSLNENPKDLEIYEKCGLKGVTMLESVENLIGEQTMVLKINELVYNSANGVFDSLTFYGLINNTVDGTVLVSQLLNYWRQHGGIPNLSMDRFSDSIKLLQESGNRTVKSELNTWEKMPLWPLALQFTEFKLPVEVMLSQGIHVAPVRQGNVFVNLGFTHFYRVNYDLDTWRAIKQILTENATSYTKRERIQLISDFCYFYASNALAEPAASVLRNEFVQLIRLRPTSFPICDVAIYNCVAPHRFTKPKHVDRNTMTQLRRRLFDSFNNASDMECRSGPAHDAMNDICTQLYGLSCL
ncbi:unnamed protein product [Caenorhabditis auriculariae]|uniref:Aminopeptidase n=1 Tax=Caenorhabditis auriculariae TaxID=2777116 RepID=A0A8S1HN91_9PELO|nr:unnamed protein product [Caenorhabditis auriculariae]